MRKILTTNVVRLKHKSKISDVKSKLLKIMFKFSVCWLWHFTKQVISSSEASLYYCVKTNCHFISLLLTISNQNSRQKASKIVFFIWVKCFSLTSELFLDIWILSGLCLQEAGKIEANLMSVARRSCLLFYRQLITISVLHIYKK